MERNVNTKFYIRIFDQLFKKTTLMAKLPKEFQFIDLSDYGRPAGRWIAKRFQHTSVTPIHVTTMFIITGLLSYSIYDL